MTLRPSPLRPPPIGDARIDALERAGDEAAKRWLIELIAARPLADAPALASSAFCEQAPALCAHVLRALGSDGALDELGSDGGSAPSGSPAGLASGLGELLHTPEAPALVHAVEALRTSLGRLAGEAVEGAPGAPLVDRLAHVCSVLARIALAGSTLTAAPSGRSHPDGGARIAANGARGTDGAVAAPGARPGGERSAGASAAGLRPEMQPPGDHGDAVGGGGGGERTFPRIEMRPGTTDLGDVEDAWRIDAAPAHEQHGGADRSADVPDWSFSVGFQLASHAADGSPFAVLAVELRDGERLRSSEAPADFEALLATVRRALAAQLRPGDLIGEQAQGRWWLVAPATQAPGARALAERLARAGRASASRHGSPLELAIGVALCPDHGTEADELAEHAEVELFAARAAGVAVAPGG